MLMAGADVGDSEGLGVAKRTVLVNLECVKGVVKDVSEKDGGIGHKFWEIRSVGKRCCDVSKDVGGQGTLIC